MARSSSVYLKNSSPDDVSSRHHMSPLMTLRCAAAAAAPFLKHHVIERMNEARAQLDRLFAVDAAASVVFGILALLAPHGILTSLSGGLYSHGVHETLRYVRTNVCMITILSMHLIFTLLTSHQLLSLYGCLRLACGWILWHVRAVDDGRFRRSVCEALCFCYTIQALAVTRAQFTDHRHTWWNWLAISVLLTLAAAYGSFRFRRGGNLIKIYELPTSGNLQ